MTKPKHLGAKSLAMIAAAVLAKRPTANVREQINVARGKAKSMTVVVTKKSKSKSDDGVGGELTTGRLVYGKPRKENIPLALRANIQRIYGRIAVATAFDNTPAAGALPGAVVLRNFNTAGTNANTDLPLVLFDLTSWFNNQAGSPLISLPQWNPIMSLATGLIAWNNNQGPSWSIEQTSAPQSSVGTVPNASDVLKSIVGKMLFYGAVGRPTKFSVSLIQLKEDYLVPDFAQSGGATVLGVGTSGTNENFLNEHTAFWQDQVRWCLYNPVMTGQPKLSSKMRTLAKTEFVIQEKLSTEPGATTGHMKLVNINIHPERVQRYDWGQYTINTHAAMEGLTITTEAGQPAAVVAPTKRMYLMVRAMTPYQTVTTGNYQTNTPSFDYNLRATHEIVA